MILYQSFELHSICHIISKSFNAPLPSQVTLASQESPGSNYHTTGFDFFHFPGLDPLDFIRDRIEQYIVYTRLEDL